jgi:hypothetical protein
VRLALIGLLALATVTDAMAQDARMLVVDLPYDRVWQAALSAVSGYPVARASGGVIETERLERAPGPGEVGLTRVAERITIQVEALAPLVTRVTVTVRAEGLSAGAWVPLAGGGPTARGILDRIRAHPG